MEGSGEEFGEEFVEEKPKSSEKIVKCNICGEEIPLRRYPSHLKESHPEEYEGWRLKIVEGKRRSQEVRELLKRAEMSESIEKSEEEMSPEQLVALEGREGLNKIKFKRLMMFLDHAPNVTSSQKKWIELRWKTYAKMRDDPSELFKALRDAGIRESICTAIVQAVFSVEEEYADILARRGEPVYVSKPTIHEPTVTSWSRESYYPSGQQKISYPAPTPYQYQPYYYQSPPPYTPSWMPQTAQSTLTKDDVLRIVNEFFKEKLEKKEFEEKIETLRSEFENIKDYIMELRHEIEKKISETESEKKRSVSPEVEVLKARLEESSRTIEKLSEQIVALQQLIERKEKDKLEAEIRSLRAEQKMLYDQLDKITKSASASGYTNDTYRLMSQLVTELGDRRPLRDIIRILFPEKYVPPTVPGSRLPPEIESELRSEGLIEYAG
ncbi:MAG: hypothetical protein QXL22_01120 [Candidatus Nezhaarchaeales archaeon]